MLQGFNEESALYFEQNWNAQGLVLRGVQISTPKDATAKITTVPQTSL